MRFKCANSISARLRSRLDCSKASVLAKARATSRAASFTSRTIRREGMFGQHLGLSMAVRQGRLVANPVIRADMAGGGQHFAGGAHINVLFLVKSEIFPREGPILAL